jgi:LmbE family N-acetylglucosaminyl deacetylase
MLRNKKILVLAPHTDDGELGCGGLISKAVRQGASVFYAAFSTADESVPATFPPNQLEIEVKNATAIIGVQPESLFIYKHEVRKLNYVRQEILEEMIKLRNKINPGPTCTTLPNRSAAASSPCSSSGCSAWGSSSS